MAEKYADDVVEELIARLAKGDGLATICRDPRMPNRNTVHRWMRADDELAQRIMDAREIGFHDRAERAVEAARKCKDPIKGRLAFDAERWILGKLSLAFADKPVVGVSLNVDAGDTFDAIARVLEGASAAIASRRDSTFIVAGDGTARPALPGGGVEDLAGDGGPGLGEDESRS